MVLLSFCSRVQPLGVARVVLPSRAICASNRSPAWTPAGRLIVMLVLLPVGAVVVADTWLTTAEAGALARLADKSNRRTIQALMRMLSLHRRGQLPIGIVGAARAAVLGGSGNTVETHWRRTFLRNSHGAVLIKRANHIDNKIVQRKISVAGL